MSEVNGSLPSGDGSFFRQESVMTPPQNCNCSDLERQTQLQIPIEVDNGGNTGPAGESSAPRWVDSQDHTNQFSFKRLIAVLAALAFTLFVAMIDQTSVSTSLPAIAQDLNAFSTISWVGTSFLIANTSFLLINGRLSDIFGR